MGHTERRLAVHDLLRHQLVPKIRAEPLATARFATCTFELATKIHRTFLQYVTVTTSTGSFH